MPAARVFVLGSGFSASMGLPTLMNLFPEVLALPEREDEGDKENTQDALAFLYPEFRRNGEPASLPPFEEFLSLVMAAEDLSFFDEGYWEKHRKSVLRLLTDCIARKAFKAEKSPLLRAFVRRLQDGDVILTFNWDTLIEKELRTQRRRLNSRQRDSSAVTVIKLHGSLDWYMIPEGISLKYPETVEWIHPPSVCRMKDHSYYDVWDVLDLPPFIIPPTSFKRPPAERFLRELWHEAFNCLVEATEVCVIGYSMPNDDLQARALLRSGLAAPTRRRRLIVVDPEPSIGKKYVKWVHSAFHHIKDPFSEQLCAGIFEVQGDTA
jgi:hypothetical protein